jgi:hypothetical protein
MALYSDQTKIFHPMVYYYHASNTGAVAGWKRINWNSSGHTHSGLTHSGGTFTCANSDSAGYYFVTCSHVHNNGAHDNYYLRIVSSNLGSHCYVRNRDGSGLTVTAILYLASGNTFGIDTHHGNSSHSCNNGDRNLHMTAFRFNNV